MARRVRGLGSVRFRDGRWEARAPSIRGDRPTASFENQAAAWDWIAEVITRRRLGPARAPAPAPAPAPTPAPPAPLPSLKFKDLARLYKVHKLKRWRPGSLRFYESHRGLLLHHFGACRIADITTRDVQEFLDGQLARPCVDRDGEPTGRTLHPNTVFKYQQVLSQLFRYAVRMDFLEKSPMAKVERVRQESRDQRVLRLHEIQAILAHAPDSQRPFFTVAALTGLRRGELFRMRWDWVDFDGGRIHVKVAKRGSNELPLAPVVRAVLAQMRAGLLAKNPKALKPNAKGMWPLVFPGRNGKMITCKAEVLKRIVAAAKLPGEVGMHAFRRGYITLVERLPGVSYSIAKALARHSRGNSNDMTARYLYPEYEELLAALTTFEQRVLTPSNVVPLKPAAA